MQTRVQLLFALSMIINSPGEGGLNLKFVMMVY